MARFDDLPADQTAVLQLVLRQGRSYEDIAGLLRSSSQAIRERALNALDALGPEEAAELDEGHRDDVGDYLLGQQSASRRAATRELLDASPAARAWARSVAGELRAGNADAELPDVPAEAAEVEEAFDALQARNRAAADRERSSRLGGLLLLVGAGITVAILVLALTGAFSKDDDEGRPSAATGTTATSTTAGRMRIEARIDLRPVAEGARALGFANIVTQDRQRAIAILGQDLAPSSRYALWLYSSPSKARRLGFFPPVQRDGDTKGRLEGIVEAPEDLAQYDELIVTRERGDAPEAPGTIVLRGPIS